MLFAYEILIAWRSTGKTPVIGLDDFKKQIGINGRLQAN